MYKVLSGLLVVLNFTQRLAELHFLLLTILS